MKNITLAVVIMFGLCATEAVAQVRSLGSLRERRVLIEQQRAAEKAEYEKEREERRAQLLQIQEELRRAREEKELESLMANGCANQKLRQLEEDTSKSWAMYEKMVALEEKSKSLSADALAIYTNRVEVLRRNYETCSNRLARARAMLTPEKIAEIKQKKKAKDEKKAREQKAKEEYRAFAADADEGIAEEIRREKERAQHEAQRAAEKNKED